MQTVLKKDEDRDTIIIFQSDNGASLFGNQRANEIDRKRLGCNYPYRGQKTLLTEGGTLAPSLIYSVQGKIRSRIVDGLFHVTDWFPTILRMARVPKVWLNLELDFPLNEIPIVKI